jgi:hypothetical protein
MAMVEYKMVDGNRVKMTAADIAERKTLDDFWDADAPNRQARKDRRTGLENEPDVQALVDRLANATSQQLDTWFAANVTTPAQAITVLKTVVKVLALKL